MGCSQRLDGRRIRPRFPHGPSKTFFGVVSLVVALALFPRISPAQDAKTYEGLTFHAPPAPLADDAVTNDRPHFLGPRHNATAGETKLVAISGPRAGRKKSGR